MINNYSRRIVSIIRLITGCTWIVFLAVVPVFALEEVSYNTFSDLSSFTLNGTAAEINVRQEVLRLTNDLGQNSSVFLKEPITLEADASFSTYFQFRISDPQGISDGVQGADGIVFVVQTQATNVGGVGGGIGYEGISPSIGIEFDTWDNGEDDGNHIGINLNGSTNSIVKQYISTPMNNGQIWHAG